EGGDLVVVGRAVGGRVVAPGRDVAERREQRLVAAGGAAVDLVAGDGGAAVRGGGAPGEGPPAGAGGRGGGGRGACGGWWGAWVGWWDGVFALTVLRAVPL